eukprot:Nk52_evm10s272 gene=Nk52_evmTU10s272
MKASEEQAEGLSGGGGEGEGQQQGDPLSPPRSVTASNNNSTANPTGPSPALPQAHIVSTTATAEHPSPGGVVDPQYDDASVARKLQEEEDFLYAQSLEREEGAVAGAEEEAKRVGGGVAVRKLSREKGIHGSAEDISANTFYRENVLLVEFKSLQQYCPTGVYVMPAEDTIHVWHGVMFIRQGLYRNAIFKFVIYMPDDFPDSCPHVKFTSSVFHPQIDQNGRVNVLRAFPAWKRGRDRIWHVLAYLKRLFYKIETDPTPANESTGMPAIPVPNPQAAELYRSNFEVYAASVKACVLESIDNQYMTHRGCSIRFTPWEPQVHEKARKEVLSGRASAASSRGGEGGAGGGGGMFGLMGGRRRGGGMQGEGNDGEDVEGSGMLSKFSSGLSKLFNG